MTLPSQPLSAVDTAWLHMECPTNLMMVTSVIELDGHVDFMRLKAVFRHRLLEFDRFRMRVVESAMPLGTPHWEEDTAFDIESHMHRLALPPPRSEAVLMEVIGDLASTPLDFSKPLWQVHLIENYHGGSVVVLRFHHCIADGTAMVGVVYRLMDAVREAPLALPPVPRQVTQRASPGWHPIRSVLDATGAVFDMTRKMTGALLHEATESLLHPSHLLDLAAAARNGAGIVGQALLMTAEPLTAFKGELGVQKHVAWSKPISLARVKAVGADADAKINDVLLAAMTGALRHYLENDGYPVNHLSLRAVVPVNLRPSERALELGNEFGLVFLTLPVNEAHPMRRVSAIREQMNELKRSPEPYIYFGLLNLLGVSSRRMEDQALEILGSKATTVMTNVAGPTEPLFLARAPIRNLMFWVPQSGRLGMGVSILSYAGKVTLGVMTDAGLVPDPGRITQRFAREFAHLERAVAADRNSDLHE